MSDWKRVRNADNRASSHVNCSLTPVLVDEVDGMHWLDWVGSDDWDTDANISASPLDAATDVFSRSTTR